MRSKDLAGFGPVGTNGPVIPVGSTARERVANFVNEWKRRANVVRGGVDPHVVIALGMSDGSLELLVEDLAALVAAPEPADEPTDEPVAVVSAYGNVHWVEGARLPPGDTYLYLRPTTQQDQPEPDWATIMEGLQLADQFFDGDDNHWQWDDGEAFPSSKVRKSLQAALQHLSGKSPWVDARVELPPEKTMVLVAFEMDGPGDWRIKTGTRVPGHPDAGDFGWLVHGGGWTPTRWMNIPLAPDGRRFYSGVSR